MPKRKNPRHGSMQFWPRVRAKRIYPRIRSWKRTDKAQLLGFPCYKVGMTHMMGIDNRKASITKGEEIFLPVTVLECPPIRILSIRFYNPISKSPFSSGVVKECLFKPAKEVDRKLHLPKKFSESSELEKTNPDEYEDITALCYTQPKLTGMKKTPELIEIRLGGKNKDKLEYLKSKIGKDFHFSEVFEPGSYVDIQGITKGKGTQGPVKRFGVSIRHHKSEKTRRGPGSLGGWKGQAHFMYRVAFAGQMGYHQRTEYNKQLLMVSNDLAKINPASGFPGYGKVSTEYVLVAGSAAGPSKRMLMLTSPRRKTRSDALPAITKIIKNRQE